MIRKEIEIYSELVDNAVVKLPDRNYLGSVVQGDSLYLLHAEAMDILDELKHSPGSPAFYLSYKLAKGLELRLEHYIAVCREHNIPLSFMIDSSVTDYDDLMIDLI